MTKTEEVVISGIGGYFPKSINIEEFQKLLLENANFLDSRWKEGTRGVTNLIGKVPSIQYFDTAYFGIHRQQCIHMDPMQRIMLERTFEALIDAGVNPADIRGKRIGVFVGSSVGENDNIFYESVVSGFGVTGHSRSMMPNRISYWLNLKGPSSDYDSNWLNGLEVIRMAYESIREGHCDSAIIGTANLVINVEISWTYKDAKLLSPDGKTRSFDAEANGYGRSDGIVVFYLQRKSKAKRNYGSIVNVKTRFNGNRDGTIMNIDQKCLTNFIKEFYEETKVKPNEVDFVEAYGCAIKDIDEKELNAIEEVYCQNRKQPLLIGAVKSNIGHSEASSSTISIVKVLIAMNSGIIPSNSNFENPNPKIKGLLNGSLKIVDTNTPWNGEYAAVNAIGLTSAYGHILLKANNKIKKYEVNDGLPRLFVASTRTEEGIQKILMTVQTHAKDAEYANLIQDIFVTPISGHLYRGYVLAGNEMKQEFEYYAGKKRPVWFVYSGMGSQWPAMAAELMRIPIFAESIKKSHEILKTKGVDLISVITTDDSKIFDNILNSFIGIAAIQIALTDLLYALGVIPDGIIGHSVGELACAYADGCLTSEQMILAAYARGKASLEAKLIPGMMAAVGIGYKEIKNQCPPTIEVACHNGPESCTISGPTKDMEDFVAALKEKGIFAKLVNVSNIAYHSRYIKPAAPLLLKYLKEIIPNALPRSDKWISTSIPQEKWDTDLAKMSSAEYHTNNLLSSVLFEEGSMHFPKDAIVIEIAPHGLLQAILKRSLNSECTNIALTQRGNKNNVDFLLSALGRMFVAGIDNMKISNFYPKIEYPVSKGTPSLAPIVQWNHIEEWRTGNEDKLNYLVSVKDIQVSLNLEEFKQHSGNQLGGSIILPPSFYLMIICNMVADEESKELQDFVFENLYFKRVLSIPKVGFIPLSAMVQKGTGEFEVICENDIVLSGIIKIPEVGEKILTELPEMKITEDSYKLTGKDVYQEFNHRGCNYSGLQKAIQELTLTNKGSMAEIKWCNKWTLFVDLMLQQIMFHAGERRQEIVTPTHIRRLAVSSSSISQTETVKKCYYNAPLGIVYTDGIQISGVRATALLKEPKAVTFNNLEFIPFFNKTFENWETALNFCFQTVILAQEYQEAKNFTVVEVVTEKKCMMIENMNKTMNHYKDVNVTYLQLENQKSIVASRGDPLLILYNSKFDTSMADYLLQSHAFVLSKSTDLLSSFNHITEISRFVVNGSEYSLVRKTETPTAVVVHIHGDTLSSKDLTKTNLQWVMQFKNTVENLKPKQRLYLLSNVYPFEGIINFIQDVQNQYPNINSLRFLFVMDKNKTFDDYKSQFNNLVKNDLVLSIIKDGVIGSYLSIPVELNKSCSHLEVEPHGNVISSNNIRFIGLNLKDESNNPEKKIELGCIDYAAINKSNERIMGLAYFDKISYQIIPDSILTWKIPTEWKTEAGATIPYSYSMAYYCLIEQAKVKCGENVLIHSGCNGIGYAAITIALNLGCKVFVTVATEEQKAFLLKKYSRLTENHIFSTENTDFEPLLLIATQGIGAHVVLNNLSGSMFDASLRCLGWNGRFIQIGQHDLEQNGSLGLSVFLKNTSFYSVSPEVLIQSSADVKKDIQKNIEKLITTLVVRRMDIDIFEKFDTVDLLRDLSKSSNIKKKVIKLKENLPIGQLSDLKEKKFFCDPRSSYLIIGGNAETWIDMAEWLVFRGAKKIVVASESKPQNASLTRRLNLLQAFYSVDIIHAPFKAHTRDSAMELVSEVFMLGPIHAVFLLPDKSDQIRNSDIKSVQFIDAALRLKVPKALFINLKKEVAGVFQNRISAGFTTCTIQWQNSLNLTDVLDALDGVLSYNCSNIYINNNLMDDLLEESSTMLQKKLNLLLPSSLDDLKQLYKKALAKPGFYQISSLCPIKPREIPPVFIIPGLLHQDYLKKFAAELMYPTYCADFTSDNMKIEDLALCLASEMEKILPNGVFNIVAISLGGIVATEVAKILQKRKHVIQMYYIDAAPETIQSTLKLLGSDIKKDLAIITKYLNVNAEVLNNLEHQSTWESRLQLVLSNINDSESEKILLRKLLMTLKQRIDDVLNYNYNCDELLEGKVYLMRPTGCRKFDNCGLSKIYEQNIIIKVMNGDHASILLNKQLADDINSYIKSY